VSLPGGGPGGVPSRAAPDRHERHRRGGPPVVTEAVPRARLARGPEEARRRPHSRPALTPGTRAHPTARPGATATSWGHREELGSAQRAGVTANDPPEARRQPHSRPTLTPGNRAHPRARPGVTATSWGRNERPAGGAAPAALPPRPHPRNPRTPHRAPWGHRDFLGSARGAGVSARPRVQAQPQAQRAGAAAGAGAGAGAAAARPRRAGAAAARYAPPKRSVRTRVGSCPASTSHPAIVSTKPFVPQT